MQEKGCVFVQRVYYVTTILKIFGATRQFSAIFFRKGYMLAKCARRTACFLPKNCKRKGVFFQKIAMERVQFRRPRWHTRVQKLGKCPPPGRCPTAADVLMATPPPKQEMPYHPADLSSAIPFVVLEHKSSNTSRWRRHVKYSVRKGVQFVAGYCYPI